MVCVLIHGPFSVYLVLHMWNVEVSPLPILWAELQGDAHLKIFVSHSWHNCIVFSSTLVSLLHNPHLHLKNVAPQTHNSTFLFLFSFLKQQGVWNSVGETSSLVLFVFFVFSIDFADSNRGKSLSELTSNPGCICSCIGCVCLSVLSVWGERGYLVLPSKFCLSSFGPIIVFSFLILCNSLFRGLLSGNIHSMKVALHTWRAVSRCLFWEI